MSRSEEEKSVDPPKSADADSTRAKAPQDEVAKQATLLRRLNLNRETVIGIFGKENDLGALLRLRTGDIVRVKVGDTALGGVVKAIGQRSVIIVAEGRTRRLRMTRW